MLQIAAMGDLRHARRAMATEPQANDGSCQEEAILSRYGASLLAMGWMVSSPAPLGPASSYLLAAILLVFIYIYIYIFINHYL